jgi:hypothetical protein
VSAMSASRLDTLQVSSIAILAPGIPSAAIPWNQRVWQFDSPSINTTILLLRFGEAVQGWFPISTGSGHTIKSDPKTTASSSAPTPKYGIGMIGDVAATICCHLCCRISPNARRFV